MDQVHLHFLLNHFPILGTLFGAILLAFGLLRKDKSLQHAALITLVLVSLLTLPAFFTGEAAEHVAEKIEGVSEHYIEEHEELAEKGLWSMMVLGVVSAAAFILTIRQNKIAASLRVITFVLAAGAFTLMVFIGKSGGEIRHSEIRKAGAVNNGGE